MLLFEFESGRLHQAHVGSPKRAQLDDAVFAALHEHVHEIIGRPLFPLHWDETPHSRLTAMDASGQVVTVEIMMTLNSAALVSALARSGRSASLGWLELANLYDGGVDAFRNEWAVFREMMPPRPVPGPRLTIITGTIADDVCPALEVLAESGVEVHEVSQRDGDDGRTFVEIAEPYRASIPTMGLVAALMASVRPELAAADQEIINALEQQANGEAGSQAPESTGQATDTVATVGEPQLFMSDIEDDFSAEDLAPEGFEAEIEANPRLAHLAQVVDAPQLLVWAQLRKGIRTTAYLTSTGVVELPDGRQFADPSQAAEAASGRRNVDGWQVFRLGDDGPRLGEAIAELERPASRGRRAL